MSASMRYGNHPEPETVQKRLGLLCSKPDNAYPNREVKTFPRTA